MRRSPALVRITVAWLATYGTAVADADAQVPIDLNRANAFSAEFAVSESPAFNMLKVDGAAILRPTTVQELATNLGGFLSDGRLSLPREIGVELSPGLLWSGPRLSLEEYQRRAPWYRTRISLATKRADTTSTATQLAFGVRIGLEDEADLRTNDDYIRFVESFHLANLRQLSGVQDSLVSSGALGPEQAIDVGTRLAATGSSVQALAQLDAVLDSVGVDDPARRALVRAVITRLAGADQLSIVDRARLDQFRDSVQNAAWNANTLEVAAGGLLAAGDSTGADLSARQWNAWLTVGRRLGSHGQLLLGGAGVLERSPTEDGWDGRAAVSARLYVGSNQIKVLTEGQLNLSEEQTWFLRGGTEFSPPIGGWFTLTAGIRGGEGVDGVALATDFTFGLSLQHVIESIQ